MSYGMTPKEFWEDDPKLAKSYRQAQKYKMEYENHKMWLNGAYTLNAMSVVMSNSFGKKMDYIKEPFKLNEPEQKTNATQEEIDKARLDAINKLTAWKDAFNNKK